MTEAEPSPRNAMLHGDCLVILPQLAAESVDFILTDPPYIACYRSRDNRTLRNDDNAAWLVPSFAAMHRVLKSDSFAISFYGWPKVDLFFHAWKRAGFRIGGHIVFRKRYPSKTAFLQYRHEAAFLLIKGNPAFPATPLPDVMDWTYTGNKLHPTQKSVHLLKPLIEAFTQPAHIVLDPFAGSGSTCVAALRAGRHCLGIELDPKWAKLRPSFSPLRFTGSHTLTRTMSCPRSFWPTFRLPRSIASPIVRRTMMAGASLTFVGAVGPPISNAAAASRALMGATLIGNSSSKLLTRPSSTTRRALLSVVVLSCVVVIIHLRKNRLLLWRAAVPAAWIVLIRERFIARRDESK